VISDENLAQLKALMEQVVTKVVTELLQAHGLAPIKALKNAAAAERMRRYRDKKRNASVTKNVTRSPRKRNAERNEECNAQAAQVLQFLNEKTGRQYQPVEANIGMIAARLKGGATVTQCRQVIAKKCREWTGSEREVYLRPATLFNATKFAQYQGELVVRPEDHGTSNG
jgi:uncharacterized phage protein (TIGR02220 family)